jgi:hypothetical protein
MEKIEFNTGRKYAANGQPIVAVRFGETVIFKDEARLIVGTFELPAGQPLTQSAVMRAYDNYSYRMAAWKKEYNSNPEPVAEPEPVTLFGLFYIDNDGKPALCDLIDGIYESCAFVDQRIAEDSAKYHNEKYGGKYFPGPLPKGVKARWIDDSVFESIEPEPVKESEKAFYTFTWRTEDGGDFYTQPFEANSLQRAVERWEDFWGLDESACFVFEVKKEGF